MMIPAAMLLVPLDQVRGEDPVACSRCGRSILPVFGESGVPFDFVDQASLDWLDKLPDWPDDVEPVVDRAYPLLYGRKHRCPGDHL